jgi:hypothetical protein
MKWAWIVDGIIRDVCQGGDPNEHYHPDVARLYDTQVPDDAFNAMEQIDGVWQFPPQPEPVFAPVLEGEGSEPDVIG